MSETHPTQQDQPRWPPISPAWIGVAVMLLINFGTMATKYSAIEDHGTRIKTLEVKDAGRDVAAAELKKDLGAINESIKDLKEEVRQRATSAPQIVLPPGYHLLPQQTPVQGGRASAPIP